MLDLWELLEKHFADARLHLVSLGSPRHSDYKIARFTHHLNHTELQSSQLQTAHRAVATLTAREELRIEGHPYSHQFSTHG